MASEQIHTPETVFHVSQESQPGRTTGVLSRPVVMSENPSNHIFVDLDVERQGDLLGDSRTTPIGITLLPLAFFSSCSGGHANFDDYMDKFCALSFRAGLRSAIRRE